MLDGPHHITQLGPPQRILLAPGPTNPPPSVLQALIAPLTGHKDPFYLQVMDETAQLLRYVSQTQNRTSMSLPGTGGAGMEAAMAALQSWPRLRGAPKQTVEHCLDSDPQ